MWWSIARVGKRPGDGLLLLSASSIFRDIRGMRRTTCSRSSGGLDAFGNLLRKYLTFLLFCVSL